MTMCRQASSNSRVRADVYSAAMAGELDHKPVCVGIALENGLGIEFSRQQARDIMHKFGLTPVIRHIGSGRDTYHCFMFDAIAWDELDRAELTRGYVEEAPLMGLEIE